MQQLSGQDAMFLYGELDNMPMHIGPVLIYDPSTAPGGVVRFKDILRTFQARMHRSPVFTRKLMNVPLGLDHPFWVEDDNVDIEFHVRHIALPKPGDWRQFCIQIARLHARPLDRAHPLWEAYIIEGLDNVAGLPKGSFALFLKIHHAAIDGATGVDIMSALHDLEPQPKQAESAKPKRRVATELPPSELDLLRKVSGSLLKQPFDLARLIGKSVPAWRRVQAGKKEHKFRSLDQKAHTRFNDRVSPHRVFGAVNFSLTEVVAIKKQADGTTVNDVMLTLVAGALRSYLLAKGELPEASLVTGAPVNVRSAQEKGTGGNVVSMMSIALRTDVASPAERLQLVHQEALASKSYLNAVGARLLTDWSNRMPAQVTALGFRAASATGLLSSGKPIFNTIVTNVPGPQVPLYMGGAQVVRSLGAGPCMDGMGLFHVVSSYNGQIALSFQACRNMMPDPGFYEECLATSFAELRDAMLKPAAPRKTIGKVGASSKRVVKAAARPTPKSAAPEKGKAKTSAGTKGVSASRQKPEPKPKAGKSKSRR